MAAFYRKRDIPDHLQRFFCPAEIGLEPTPEAYVAALVAVFREVWRVLKDEGTLWLVLGDSYAQSGMGGNPAESPFRKQATNVGSLIPGRKAPVELKPKDLVGIPWRVAFALQADGWYLRSDIIWAKPNPMPESVTDRPTRAHEYVFLLSKQQQYYYDATAIKEQVNGNAHARGAGVHAKAMNVDEGIKANASYSAAIRELVDDRNARSVWTITTQPYPEAHFATFPEALPERCIKAGSRVGDTVLDPFCGSGTTGQVAIQLGRSFIGIELNATYADLARQRIGTAAPLFAVERTPVERDAELPWFDAADPALTS